MEIRATTEAKDGHLILYIIDRKGNNILTLKDTDSGTCTLVPGKTYRFEWHIWCAKPATFSIEAHVTPAGDHFPQPFQWHKTYQNPTEDMGGFYFTASQNHES